MIELVFLVLFIGLILCLVDMQAGMYAVLFAGFLQDPLRKMFAEQPVYVTALVILFAAVTFVGAKIRDSVFPSGAIPGWNDRTLVPTPVLVALVLLPRVAAVPVDPRPRPRLRSCCGARGCGARPARPPPARPQLRCAGPIRWRDGNSSSPLSRPGWCATRTAAAKAW